jgi:hypothetical protein
MPKFHKRNAGAIGLTGAMEASNGLAAMVLGGTIHQTRMDGVIRIVSVSGIRC